MEAVEAPVAELAPEPRSPTRTRRPLSPPPKPPELLGFYLPDSPFATRRENSTFRSDKSDVSELARPAHLDATSLQLTDHHGKRRWSLSLALFAAGTGAYRRAPGVKCYLGGYTERPAVSVLMTDVRLCEAEADMRSQLRVAARRLRGKELEREKLRIQEEFQRKISRRRANVPTKQAQTPPGSPGGTDDGEESGE